MKLPIKSILIFLLLDTMFRTKSLICKSAYPWKLEWTFKCFISKQQKFSEFETTKRIVIKASEVAAIIGKNKYKSPDEVLDDMWKKYVPETFEGLTSLELALESLDRASINEISLLNEAFQYNAKNSTDVELKIKTIEKQISESKTLSSNDKENLNSLVRGTVSVSFGIKAEDRTSEKLEIENQMKIKKDNNFYNYPICNIENMNFVIVGKIDGIEKDEKDGSNVLIEIKNRIRKLRKSVPIYEFIQIQTYLNIIPGLKKAKLIEQYNNEIHTEVIIKDVIYWEEEILPKIVNFCIEFHHKTTT